TATSTPAAPRRPRPVRSRSPPARNWPVQAAAIAAWLPPDVAGTQSSPAIVGSGLPARQCALNANQLLTLFGRAGTFYLQFPYNPLPYNPRSAAQRALIPWIFLGESHGLGVLRCAPSRLRRAYRRARDRRAQARSGRAAPSRRRQRTRYGSRPRAPP